MVGYKDYFLLLSPDDKIKERINYYKEFATSLIADFPSAGSKAHVSIKQYIRQKPYLLEQMIDQLELKLRTMPPVTFKIDDFKFFIHPNSYMTIYAAIQPNYATDKWLALLRQQLKLSIIDFIPHITVARKIDIDSFYKLWPRFHYFNCKESFLIDRLYILERETFGADKKWKIYKELPFENKLQQI